jgi:hypothetical protein
MVINGVTIREVDLVRSINMFAITLNKPAHHSFFREERARGMRIKITPNKTVQFQPVLDTKDDDVIPLDSRSRGGLGGTVEGLMADELHKYLTNPNGNPFFTIKRARDGWYALKPAPSQPSRFTPHLRIWSKDNPASTRPLDHSRILEEVREAKAIIHDHENQRNTKATKAGRPPREVTDARAKLQAVAEAAREVLPVDEIKRACSMLINYLEGPSPSVDAVLEAGRLLGVNTRTGITLSRTTTRQGRHKVTLGRANVDPETDRIASDAASRLGFKDDPIPVVATSRRRGEQPAFA